MTEHLLDRPQVCASLEQVRGERVPQQMGVNALWLEPGLARELAQDEECAGARERAAAGVQEQLRAVALVEVGPAAPEVAAHGFDRRPPDRDDALLSALADDADEPAIEIDPCLLDAHSLGHAEPRPVE